jgi:hypothetical protein
VRQFLTKIKNMEDLAKRIRIAEELLGERLEDGVYGRCPGVARHSLRNGRRDFRVLVDGAPTAHCVHDSCASEVHEFNMELRRRIWLAEHGESKKTMPEEWGRTAPEPRRVHAKNRPDFDTAKLELFAGNVKEVIDFDWLVARSPVALTRGLRNVSVDFLEMLYQAGEKVIVFTEFASQGQFGYHVGDGGWRLGRDRGVKAVRSDLPLGGPEGVWFLCNPVCGDWKPNPANLKRDGEAAWGRRHGACVTSWRYLILESDVAAPSLWLRVLVQLHERIAAIYTSGGKSVHALVRVDAVSKLDFDRHRDFLVSMLAPLGADAAAMSAVRLSRLPGCLRGDRLQELLYLDPCPSDEPIFLKRRLKDVAR